MTHLPLTTGDALPRLYLSDLRGSSNPEVEVQFLDGPIHALFCGWVKSHYHVRDFVEAMEHSATLAFIAYVWRSAPNLVGQSWPPLPALEYAALAGPSRETLAGPRIRFHDEDGDIDNRIVLERADELATLLFLRWCGQGYHPRDFIEAFKNSAINITSAYKTSCEMNGLGGCKGPEDFLNPG